MNIDLILIIIDFLLLITLILPQEYIKENIKLYLIIILVLIFTIQFTRINKIDIML
jgi:hypothetical protein